MTMIDGDHEGEYCFCYTPGVGDDFRFGGASYFVFCFLILRFFWGMGFGCGMWSLDRFFFRICYFFYKHWNKW